MSQENDKADTAFGHKMPAGDVVVIDSLAACDVARITVMIESNSF